MNATIKIEYQLLMAMTGDMEHVLAYNPAGKRPTVTDIVMLLGDMAFMIETVAHLQGKEASMLPVALRARKMIDILNPSEVVLS